MEFLLLVGVIIISTTCISIEVKIKKTNEQNTQIIELLKRLNEK